LQLPYVPVRNGRLALRWQYKSWAAEVSGMFTGSVVGIGNKTLEGYSLLNLQMNKTARWKKVEMTMSVQGNNLLNTAYQVMQYRPMPGRNIMISLQINLK
jgi:outer membrane cobalamin receptor